MSRYTTLYVVRQWNVNALESSLSKGHSLFWQWLHYIRGDMLWYSRPEVLVLVHVHGLLAFGALLHYAVYTSLDQVIGFRAGVTQQY